jgi:PKD repeat protein
MTRKSLALLLALGLFVFACSKDGNPVALPTDPSGGASFTLGVTSDANPLQAKSSTPATITIIARKSDGTPPPNGTEVSINTSLGNFGLGADGKPVQLVSRALVDGMTTLQFFPGDAAGVAKILVQSGTTIGNLNLQIVEPPPLPAANFTCEASGLTVLCTDASTDATSWHWDFGEAGEGDTSTDRNPSYTYKAAGSYTVTLTAKNSAGEATKQKFVQVSAGAPPAAAFTVTVDGQQANFIDKSSGNPTSWEWDFGDQQGSTERNPVHNYRSPGTYTATLTVRNAAGQDSTSEVVKIEVGAPPEAKFVSAVNGRTVTLVDQSTGNPNAWTWDFGDGTAKQYEQNVQHTYAAPGNYIVTLRVENGAGSDSTAAPVTIVASPPVAKFKATVNGRTVNFVDQSTGNPTQWEWDFGDGSRSTEQHPAHTYAEPGTYTVTLKVTNADGSNTTADAVVIEGGEPPVADFDYTVNPATRRVKFVDRSTNEPTSWEWDFGDDSAISPDNFQEDPVHQYSAPGKYTVVLTVKNSFGEDTIAKVVEVPEP